MTLEKCCRDAMSLCCKKPHATDLGNGKKLSAMVGCTQSFQLTFRLSERERTQNNGAPTHAHAHLKNDFTRISKSPPPHTQFPRKRHGDPAHHLILRQDSLDNANRFLRTVLFIAGHAFDDDSLHSMRNQSRLASQADTR